jgi:hypothetical protein
METSRKSPFLFCFLRHCSPYSGFQGKDGKTRVIAMGLDVTEKKNRKNRGHMPSMLAEKKDLPPAKLAHMLQK